MNVRFPLYAKVLLWFFLNLLLLGLIFWIFVAAQFRLGWDSLLMGKAGNPIQDVTQIISDELNRSARTEWDGVLKRYSQEYQVQFGLFHNNGSQIAGESLTLPREVLEKLRGQGSPRPPDDPLGLGMGRRPGDGGGPPPGRGFGPPYGPGPEGDFGPPDGFRPVPRPQAAGPPNSPPKFMVHTSGPSRYWVGVRIHHSEKDGMGPMPTTLMAMSTSIRGGGLFIDFVPWVLVGCGVVMVSVLFWLPLVRGITRSISQITYATEEIAQGRFDTRVADKRRDELGRLGLAINQMAGRLSGFVSGQKRFLGDIAHELCSPIARIQLSLGILEQRADEKQKAYVDDLREEVQQMSSLVNELLSFSKASLEPAAVKLQAVNLLQVVRQAVRREANDTSKIEVTVPGEIMVRADQELLLRSLANLIRNALRYAGDAGPITVVSRAESNGVTVTISDGGPGVPEASLAQLFDPFYRPEVSRNRESGGVGLGLAIVKTCIESCGGTVQCRNRQPTGLEVILKLRPADAADDADALGSTSG